MEKWWRLAAGGVVAEAVMLLAELVAAGGCGVVAVVAVVLLTKLVAAGGCGVVMAVAVVLAELVADANRTSGGYWRLLCWCWERCWRLEALGKGGGGGCRLVLGKVAAPSVVVVGEVAAAGLEADGR